LPHLEIADKSAPCSKQTSLLASRHLCCKIISACPRGFLRVYPLRSPVYPLRLPAFWPGKFYAGPDLTFMDLNNVRTQNTL
jgi:hypothetical protein